MIWKTKTAKYGERLNMTINRLSLTNRSFSLISTMQVPVQNYTENIDFNQTNKSQIQQFLQKAITDNQGAGATNQSSTRNSK